MKKLLIVLVCLGIAGCATPLTYEQVVFNDGINKQEAIAIAQKHIIEDSELKDKVDSRSGRISWEDKDEWGVSMYLRPDNREYGKLGSSIITYLIVINKQTGKITGEVYDK